MPTVVRSAAVLLSLLSSLQAFAETDADRGAKIAAQGTTEGVAPCMACHGPDGAGMAAACLLSTGRRRGAQASKTSCGLDRGLAIPVLAPMADERLSLSLMAQMMVERG